MESSQFNGTTPGRALVALALLGALGLSGGCRRAAEEAAAAEQAANAAATAAAAARAKAAPLLTAAELGSLTPLHTFGPDVYLAGQPNESDLRELAAKGLRTVINLRTPGENDAYDEAALAAELGLRYESHGFRAPETLTDELLTDVRRLMTDAERPLLLHCASANRVGALWLAHRTLDGGLEWEAALVEAKAVGLKSVGYEERVQAFVTAAQLATGDD